MKSSIVMLLAIGSSSARWFIVAVLLSLVGACAGGRAVTGSVRTPHDVPDHFLVGSHTRPTTTEPNSGCRNPMVDPRDGTRLLLVGSSAVRGDYEVPVHQYGVGKKELLRLDCGTGEMISIVKR